MPPCILPQINAERVARLVRQPVAAAVLRELNEFSSGAHPMLRPLPAHLARQTVADLQLFLPDATLMGLFHGCTEPNTGSAGGSSSHGNSSSGGGGGIALLNPPADTVAQPGDQLVVLCGPSLTALHKPLPLPPPSLPS